MTKINEKRELWQVLGGIGLLVAGIFVILPLFQAFLPALLTLGIILGLAVAAGGLVALGFAFSKYRWPDVTEFIESQKKTRSNGLTNEKFVK